MGPVADVPSRARAPWRYQRTHAMLTIRAHVALRGPERAAVGTSRSACRCARAPRARASAVESSGSSTQSGDSSYVSAYRTEDVLRTLRKRVKPQVPDGMEVWLWGLGRHMGTACAWSLRFSATGAFREEIRSKHFTTRWGHAGGEGDRCWEVDSSGVPKTLEMDDHENMLLVAWLRTGAWLLPAVEGRLEMEELCFRVADRGCGLWSNGLPQSTWEASLDGDLLGGGVPGGAGAEEGAKGAADDLLALKVRLKGSRLWAYVMVLTTSWLPRGICLPYGFGEWWDLVDWRQWAFQESGQGDGGDDTPVPVTLRVDEDGAKTGGRGVGRGRRAGVGGAAGAAGAGAEARQPRGMRRGETLAMSAPGTTRPRTPGSVIVPSPKVTEHVSAAGGRNTYEVLDVQLVAEGTGDPQGATSEGLRSVPLPVLSPPDTSFESQDGRCGSRLHGWVTPSGHVVVPVRINGELVGHFLVDTGASGLVIEPKVAQRLKLEAYGEIFVTGMGGNTRSQFRRARTLQVGPMVMREPVLMELPVAPIVSPSKQTGDICGILGYDFFRRATVALPQVQSAPSSSRPSSMEPLSSPVSLTLWDPVRFLPPPHVEGCWQDVHMISNLPHVHVRFLAPDDREQVALFMLDSGAGSIDLMFHPRAVTELGLASVAQSAPSRLIKGVGQDVVVKHKRFPWAELAGRRFHDIECLLAQADGSGLDLSLYTAGIVCGDLLFRSELILDYPRKRIAFLPVPGAAAPPESAGAEALAVGPFGVVGRASDAARAGGGGRRRRAGGPLDGLLGDGEWLRGGRPWSGGNGAGRGR